MPGAISQVMTRDPEVIEPDATLQEAAQLMLDRDIGALPVCEGRRLIGMLTDRDITIRATAAGKAPQSTTVREAMSDATLTCTEEDSVDEVLQKMGDQQVRRIPVIDDQQNLVGIVSLGDLAVDQAEGTEETLRQISEPS